jgi:hypothetical protein
MIASTRHHVADRGMPRRTDARFAAKCDLPPHTDVASTTDAASTRFALPPRIAKYVCSALAVL